MCIMVIQINFKSTKEFVRKNEFSNYLYLYHYCFIVDSDEDPIPQGVRSVTDDD